MMKHNIDKIIFILCAVFSLLWGGNNVTKVGNSAASFLKIGVGARAAGMGGSFSAMDDDITSIYWNAAGLSGIQSNQLFISHINWLASISYDFFAIGIPVNRSSSVGLYAMSVQVPEDEVRTVLQPDGTGEFFDASDLALGVSYSRHITDRFSVGVVGKYIQERIWSMTSNSIALDIGTLYKSNWKNLRIGIVLNNFGSKMKLTGRANLLAVDPDPTIEGNIETIRAELEMGRWDIPLNVKTSIALDIITMPNYVLTTAIDMVHPNDNLEFINFGGEAKILKMMYLRAGYHGYGMDKSEGGLSYGAGLNIHTSSGLMFKIDYALTDWGRLKNINQLSVGLGF